MAEQLKQIRRAALLVLYAADVGGLTIEQALATDPATLAEAFDASLKDAPDWSAVTQRVQGVMEAGEEIDEEIRRLSPTWRLSRMAALDRNLLRLGIFEILHEITAPLIAINACVELGKEFGAESTPGFINGLLDQLCRDHEIAIASTRSS